MGTYIFAAALSISCSLPCKWNEGTPYPCAILSKQEFPCFILHYNNNVSLHHAPSKLLPHICASWSGTKNTQRAMYMAIWKGCKNQIIIWWHEWKHKGDNLINWTINQLAFKWAQRRCVRVHTLRMRQENGRNNVYHE